METQILTASEESVDLAGQLLKCGAVVAIPTETVYGLAADAFNASAVCKIFEAKGRPQDNPLIVHICDLCQVKLLSTKWSEKAAILAEKFWPGPLTMILPKTDDVPDAVSCGLDTVGIRFPSNKTAQDIIRAAGIPLAAPSANRSGSPSPTSAQHVFNDMNGRIPLIIDSGSCEVGVESTVITLAGEVPVLLRPGAVTYEQLCAAIGQVEVAKAVLEEMSDNEKPASPGMKYKHYAPKAQVIILDGTAEATIKYISENAVEGDCVLCYEGEQDSYDIPCITFGREDDPLSQSHSLFDALRRVDDMGVSRVFARCPSSEGVGLAVLNRLLRAAGFNKIVL